MGSTSLCFTIQVQVVAFFSSLVLWLGHCHTWICHGLEGHEDKRILWTRDKQDSDTRNSTRLRRCAGLYSISIHRGPRTTFIRQDCQHNDWQFWRQPLTLHPLYRWIPNNTRRISCANFLFILHHTPRLSPKEVWDFPLRTTPSTFKGPHDPLDKPPGFFFPFMTRSFQQGVFFFGWQETDGNSGKNTGGFTPRRHQSIWDGAQLIFFFFFWLLDMSKR
jgi:hypothetical protein